MTLLFVTLSCDYIVTKVYRVRKGYLRTTYVSIIHLDTGILIFHLDQSCSLELSALNRFAVKSAHL